MRIVAAAVGLIADTDAIFIRFMMRCVNNIVLFLALLQVGYDLHYQYNGASHSNSMVAYLAGAGAVNSTTPAATTTTTFGFRHCEQYHPGPHSNGQAEYINCTGRDGTATNCATVMSFTEIYLICPAKQGIIDLQFISVGNPTGQCGNFHTGDCHDQAAFGAGMVACVDRISCKLKLEMFQLEEACQKNVNLAVEWKCGTNADIEALLNGNDSSTNNGKLNTGPLILALPLISAAVGAGLFMYFVFFKKKNSKSSCWKHSERFETIEMTSLTENDESSDQEEDDWVVPQEEDSYRSHDPMMRDRRRMMPSRKDAQKQKSVFARKPGNPALLEKSYTSTPSFNTETILEEDSDGL